jgi:hypothetical protein
VNSENARSIREDPPGVPLVVSVSVSVGVLRRSAPPACCFGRPYG